MFIKRTTREKYANVPARRGSMRGVQPGRGSIEDISELSSEHTTLQTVMDKLNEMSDMMKILLQERNNLPQVFDGDHFCRFIWSREFIENLEETCGPIIKRVRTDAQNNDDADDEQRRARISFAAKAFSLKFHKRTSKKTEMSEEEIELKNYRTALLEFFRLVCKRLPEYADKGDLRQSLYSESFGYNEALLELARFTRFFIFGIRTNEVDVNIRGTRDFYPNVEGKKFRSVRNYFEKYL